MIIIELDKFRESSIEITNTNQELVGWIASALDCIGFLT